MGFIDRDERGVELMRTKFVHWTFGTGFNLIALCLASKIIQQSPNFEI